MIACEGLKLSLSAISTQKRTIAGRESRWCQVLLLVGGLIELYKATMHVCMPLSYMDSIHK